MKAAMGTILCISVIFSYLMAASAQGLQGSTYKTTRFVTSPSTRVTSPVYRSMAVVSGVLCASSCSADHICVGYNLRVTSSADVLLCEFVNDIITTVSDSTSTFSTFQEINNPSDPDFVPMPNAAFSVYLDQTASATSVVQFDNYLVNLAESFDTEQNNFIAPREGYYWQHIHSFTSSVTQCDYSITGTAGYPAIGLYSDVPSSAPMSNTLSRDDLRWLPLRTQLHVTSPTYTIGTSTLTYPIIAAWAAFRLDEFMISIVAFNVYQNATITTPSLQSQPVTFPNVVVNAGGGWDAVNAKFVAPVSGIYVFGYGTAGTGGTQPSFTLATSTGLSYDAMYENSGAMGIHSTHRTVLVNLAQGQNAWISGLGTQSYGNLYQIASFKGFLYSPSRGVQVAWFATASSGGVMSSSTDITLATIAINVGNAWLTTGSKNMATIPASAGGIYYIVFGAVQSPSSGVTASLFINNALASTAGQGFNTASNIYCEAVHMAPLAANTKVTLRITYGGYAAGTGMAGFLLYPQ